VTSIPFCFNGVSGVKKIDVSLAMIAGGGAAFMRAKVIASVCDRFTCGMNTMKQGG
jgi:ribose 5-phosphate isomerase